jgi:hypothetical protein
MKKSIEAIKKDAERLADKIYDRRPNLYKFLTYKGVDSKTAEAAQEMVCEAFAGAGQDVISALNSGLASRVKKLEARVDRVTSCFDDEI